MFLLHNALITYLQGQVCIEMGVCRSAVASVCISDTIAGSELAEDMA